MSNTRLYINNEEVTTDQSSLDVTISYSIESIVPGEVQGAHSKRTVKIPATKELIQLYEYITKPGTITTNAYKFLTARLQSGGIPILNGKAKLQSVDALASTDGFEPTEFKVGLLGTNSDWFADVGNLLIRNLGWGEVTVSIAEVEENRAPLDNEYAWILLKWQEWERENSVTHTEFTPAIFVWQILEKAFGSQGYQLISPFNSDPFNRLLIPVPKNLDADYLRDNVNMRASVPSPANIDVGSVNNSFKISFTNETTDPNFDFGGNYDVTGTYTVPITALYEIIVELNFNIVANYEIFSLPILILEWHVNGVVVAVYDFLAGAFPPLIFNSVIVFELIQDLNEGDTVELYLRCENLDSLVVTNLTGYQTVEAEKDEFNLAEVYDLTAFIPSSWYVRDLIKDLTFIFNLAWETDVAGGKVYTYPKDDYYLTYRENASGAITTSAFGGFFQDNNLYDLSVREVRGGELDIIDDYKRNTILAYSTDDPTTEAEEQRRGVNIYSGGYQFPEDRFENGIEFLYTSFFAKTIQINDVEITASAVVSSAFGVQIPLLYGGDYNLEADAKPDYYLAPRLLYYAGRRGGLDGRVNMYYEATSATSAFDFPASFVTNYNDPSAVDWSLSFSDESTNYLQVVPGLFRTMHLQEFKRREIGRRYTTKAKWSLGDIVNLSFRNKCAIGSSRFILQNLEFNPNSSDFSKTVILYDERPNVTDLAKIVNTASVAGSNPQPGTVTGSGSGVVGAGGSGDKVNIYISRTEFLNSQTNVLVLDMASGITKVPTAGIQVYQNGQEMLLSQYSISGVTVTIDPTSHWNDSNYVVIVNGVTKG